MSLKFSKSLIVFLFSPYISVYFILKDIYYNKKIGYVLFAILFSLLSYLYIPGANGDKSYYIHLHEYFSSISINEGLFYIHMKMTDAIFYYLILMFASLGVSFPVLSGLVTGISVGVIFTVYRKSVAKANLSKFMSLVLFLTLIGTISLPYIFSVMRFYLALSFVVLGFYYCFVNDKKTAGLIYLLFAATIHFSTMVFFLVACFYMLFNRNITMLKIGYFASFVFVIYSPIDFLKPFTEFDSIYSAKLLSYALEKEFEITNTGHAIFLFINKLWYFLINLYVLINLRRNRDGWFQVLLMLLIVANFTYAFPFIFNRYAFIALVVFIFVLIEDYRVNRYNYFFIASYFILSMMTTSLDILIERNHFRESFVRTYALTLPTILAVDPLRGKHFSKGTL
jgi:hypothetical protein